MGFVTAGWRMPQSEVLLSLAAAVEAARADDFSSLFEETAFHRMVLRASRLAVSAAVCWA